MSHLGEHHQQTAIGAHQITLPGFHIFVRLDRIALDIDQSLESLRDSLLGRGADPELLVELSQLTHQNQS